MEIIATSEGLVKNAMKKLQEFRGNKGQPNYVALKTQIQKVQTMKSQLDYLVAWKELPDGTVASALNISNMLEQAGNEISTLNAQLEVFKGYMKSLTM